MPPDRRSGVVGNHPRWVKETRSGHGTEDILRYQPKFRPQETKLKSSVVNNELSPPQSSHDFIRQRGILRIKKLNMTLGVGKRDQANVTFVGVQRAPGRSCSLRFAALNLAISLDV